MPAAGRLSSWAEPPPGIDDPRDRRRLRLLLALLVPMVPLTYGASILFPLFDPTHPTSPLQSPGALVGLVAGTLLLAAYIAGRGGHARVAMGLTVLVGSSAVWIAAILNRATPAVQLPLFFLSVGVILASLFLTWRGTAWIAASSLVLLAALPALFPEFTIAIVIPPWIFLAMVSALIVVYAGIREKEARELEVKSNTLLEMETRYRVLFDTTVEGITVHDHGFIVEANQAFADLSGVSIQDLRARSVASLLAQAPVSSPGRTEGVLLRADGTSSPVELVTKAARLGGRDVSVTAWRDLTERRRIEEERMANLRRLEEVERLKEMDRFKTQFINTAAHELATPLTPLGLQLEVLKRGVQLDPERHQKAMHVLDRNVNRLSGLVHEILDVARMQSMRLSIRTAPVAIDRIVAEAVDSFEESAIANHVVIVRRIDPGLTAPADAQRVTQVLFNLLSNALKFTSSPGQITVEASRVGDDVVVRVRDTGIGLSADQIDRLFRPFSQVHDTNALPRGGTGLGLYICKGIIESHGGRLWVESDGPGRGSTFVFALPVKGPSPGENGSGAAPGALIATAGAVRGIADVVPHSAGAAR
ncbi:MAG: sensor histidine kinase [Thermoplasmatota archaeon]